MGNPQNANGCESSPGRRRKVCLIAETIDQAVEVMVRGESGILACTPSDRTPRYNASRKMLIWPNGAEAQVYSASNPESLRGPQFDCAWADELGKWRKPVAAWNMPAETSSSQNVVPATKRPKRCLTPRQNRTSVRALTTPRAARVWKNT